MEDKVKEKIQEFLKTLQDQMYYQKIEADEFCEKMGITRQTLYNWINGKSKMSLESYYRALDILGAKEQIKTKKIKI